MCLPRNGDHYAGPTRWKISDLVAQLEYRNPSLSTSNDKMPFTSVQFRDLVCQEAVREMLERGCPVDPKPAGRDRRSEDRLPASAIVTSMPVDAER